MTPIDDEFERTIVPVSGRAPEFVPAPEDTGHYLVTITETGPGTRVEVGADPVTIGRDPRRTIAFADNDVSRLHASVSLNGQSVIVEDLGSTNGTFVDGSRLAAPTPLQDGSVIQVGNHTLRYERRSRRDIEKAQELDRDLLKARNYVFSLLPTPQTDGAVHAEWCFVPSTQLGGDAFGYYWLDPDTFVFYLVDVSGHGVGSAMHSVAILNVLRQRALPGVDFTDPSQVLSSLNERFQMDSHNGLFFTMWYGVYRVGARTLSYGSAGHHPSFLVPSDRSAAQPLGAPALMIGAFPSMSYDVLEAPVPAGSSVYVFSDGIFEIATRDGKQWSLNDFLPLLCQPPSPGVADTQRIYNAVTAVAAPGPLDDDVSLLRVSFP